ncbi:MAG: hypothetical protein PHY08_01610 [Candidatus Cloacimonetes bacterium]|nr:hypothetical protein [Candidatus Cloacimonadota bacterium]
MHHKKILCYLVILFFFNVIPTFAEEYPLIEEENIINHESFLDDSFKTIVLQYADEEEISSFNFLNSTDIKSLIEYRKNDLFTDINSLRKAGLNEEKIELLLPFIIFSKEHKINSKLETFTKYIHNQQEIKEQNYYTLNYDNHTLFLQKEFSNQNNANTNQLGFSLQSNFSKTKILIGQYKINNGYGLLINSNAFMSIKPGFNTDFTKTKASITPTRKDRYSRNFIGLSIENKINKNLSLFLFGSTKFIGVNLNNNKIEKIFLDEINPKNTIRHSNYGFLSVYKSNNFHNTVFINFNRYEKEFSNTRLHNNNLTLSFSNSYDFLDYRLFSELAFAQKSFAFIGGLKLQQKYFTQILSLRHIKDTFFSEYSNFICDNNQNNNEQGIFYKIETQTDIFQIKAFADIFENLKPIDRYEDKKLGSTYGLEYSNHKILRFTVSIKQKRDQELRNFQIISKLYEREKTYFNLNLFQIETNTLKTTLSWNYQLREYTQINLKENAYLLSQAIKLRINNLTANFIVGIFETQIPLYYHQYSGKYNNALLVLSDEGNFVLLHLKYNIWNKLHTECAYHFINKDKKESSISLLISTEF